MCGENETTENNFKKVVTMLKEEEYFAEKVQWIEVIVKVNLSCSLSLYTHTLFCSFDAYIFELSPVSKIFYLFFHVIGESET